MANALYPKFKQACLSGNVNMTTSDVKAILVDLADYTYSAAHEFLSDVPAAAREEISAALGSKTLTDGTFDSADPSWPSSAGDPVEAVILVVGDTATPATCRLAAFYDTGVTGLPLTLNGGNVTGTVNGSGWFSL
jgi:hypothetical protein